MAETAEATIAEAIEGYKAHDVERVLDQFHDQALIIGTRDNERWNSKDEVREDLERELATVEVEGPMTETGAEDVFTRHIGEGLALYYRDGYVIFNERRLHGRWTAALHADEKGDWKILHSHFSLPEGQTTPGFETSA